MITRQRHSLIQALEPVSQPLVDREMMLALGVRCRSPEVGWGAILGCRDSAPSQGKEQAKVFAHASAKVRWRGHYTGLSVNVWSSWRLRWQIICR